MELLMDIYTVDKWSIYMELSMDLTFVMELLMYIHDIDGCILFSNSQAWVFIIFPSQI